MISYLKLTCFFPASGDALHVAWDISKEKHDSEGLSMNEHVTDVVKGLQPDSILIDGLLEGEVDGADEGAKDGTLDGAAE